MTLIKSLAAIAVPVPQLEAESQTKPKAISLELASPPIAARPALVAAVF